MCVKNNNKTNTGHNTFLLITHCILSTYIRCIPSPMCRLVLRAPAARREFVPFRRTHNGSVWSFDKTFNLRALYMTVSMYRNLALNRAASGRSPTFISPLFVHGQSNVDTYHDIFSRLASCMLELNLNVRRFKISRITDGQLSILIVSNKLIIYIYADSS